MFLRILLHHFGLPHHVSYANSSPIVNNGVNAVLDTATVPIGGSEMGFTRRRQLSFATCKLIERHLLLPLLKEPKLKPFHRLVESIPSRVVNKKIVCLRDLERVLLWLSPVSVNILVNGLRSSL